MAHLPPMKRYMQAYGNRHSPPPPSPSPPPPPPSPPPPFVAAVHRRRRTPYVTFRNLLDQHGRMSGWRRSYIRPQNFEDFQALRTRLYGIAGADDMGVSHGRQAVIYYLTRRQLLLDRNQPFRHFNLVFNWNGFANSVQRFRITWEPLNQL